MTILKNFRTAFASAALSFMALNAQAALFDDDEARKARAADGKLGGSEGRDFALQRLNFRPQHKALRIAHASYGLQNLFPDGRVLAMQVQERDGRGLVCNFTVMHRARSTIHMKILAAVNFSQRLRGWPVRFCAVRIKRCDN